MHFVIKILDYPSDYWPREKDQITWPSSQLNKKDTEDGEPSASAWWNLVPRH